MSPISDEAAGMKFSYGDAECDGIGEKFIFIIGIGGDQSIGPIEDWQERLRREVGGECDTQQVFPKLGVF